MSARDDGGLSHSMTDLMSGVAVTFLLLAAIFMVQTFAARVSQAKTENETKANLAQIRKEDGEAIQFLQNLKSIIGADLREVIDEPIYDPQKDRYLLTLTLARNVFTFGSAECDLNGKMQDAVRSGLLDTVKAICSASNADRHLLAINLEGHTDDKPFFPDVPRCGAISNSKCDANSEHPECVALGFENNVRLSGARAQNLFFALRRASVSDEALADCLTKRFVVSGRGPAEAEGEDDASREQDRRVVLRVRVRGAQLPTSAPAPTPPPAVP